jgi:hypothetical protein
MPFKSQAQRGFMYSKHQKLAKEMESKTPKGKKLPDKVEKKFPDSKFHLRKKSALSGLKLK